MVTTQRIKLVSINIERDWHYETVFSFLKTERPEVVCMQEILDRDVPRFKQELQMEGLFVPTAISNLGRGTEELAKAGVKNGNAIFTSLPISLPGSLSYCDCGSDRVTHETRHFHKVCAYLTVEKGDESFTIATTHFTWTPDGEPNDEQRADIKTLLKVLKPFPGFVFCGDFNAPRGGEIWANLAARYRDNIPKEYRSSLDTNLHRLKGEKELVVDGLWSTPHYRVFEVRLVEGVSDHNAVVGFVERV